MFKLLLHYRGQRVLSLYIQPKHLLQIHWIPFLKKKSVKHIGEDTEAEPLIQHSSLESQLNVSFLQWHISVSSTAVNSNHTCDKTSKENVKLSMRKICREKILICWLVIWPITNADSICLWFTQRFLDKICV